MIKTCVRCKKTSNISGFYKHPSMADGFLNICKICTKKRVMLHRLKNIESIRKYDRDRSKSEKRREHLSKNSKKFRRLNPKKYKAHCIVNNAIRDKKLTRQPCHCGKKGHAHHDDYDKPLDIIWLCAIHHAERHKMLKSQKFM